MLMDNIPFRLPGVLPMAIGAWLWARWLRRRYPQAQRLAWAQLAAIAVPVASVSVTVMALRRAFGSLQDVPAHQRATALADSSTMAMWSTWAALVQMVVLLLVLAVVHARLSGGAWRGPPGVGEPEDAGS